MDPPSDMLTPPTTQESQDSQDSDSSSIHSDPGPKYTVDELAAIFLDFYTFLTTLHYDAADLKVPPPEGWGDIIPSSDSTTKSPFATEVLRHLPYFRSKAAINYKSGLIDYTFIIPESMKRALVEPYDLSDEFINDDGYAVDAAHVF